MPKIITKVQRLARILVAKEKAAQETKKLVNALAKNIKIKIKMMFINLLS